MHTWTRRCRAASAVPALAAVPAAFLALACTAALHAQVPQPERISVERARAALPADTSRLSAVERLRVSDGKLLFTIEQGTVTLPDGIYRGEDGTQITVRDGGITQLRAGAAPAVRPELARPPVRRTPVRGATVTATEVKDDRLLLRTGDGGELALADGTYTSDDGIRFDVKDGRPIQVGFLPGFRIERITIRPLTPPRVDIPPPPPPEDPGRPRHRVRFTEEGGHLIPLSDRYLHEGLPNAVRRQVEDLYGMNKSLRHLDLMEFKAAAFVTGEHEPYLVEPAYGRCLQERPAQEAALRRLAARLRGLHEEGREIDALAIAPSGAGWIVVSGRDVFDENIPAPLGHEARQRVRAGHRIDLVAITPGEPVGFILASGGDFRAENLPAGVEAALREKLFRREAIHDVAFNPRTYDRAADRGWVVVGEESFVSHGNTHTLCAHLTQLGLDGSCHAPAAPLPDLSEFEFSPERARLMVLVHGITQQPHYGPKEFIAEYRHAQHYWGFGFLRELLGHTMGDLHTLGGRRLEADGWADKEYELPTSGSGAGWDAAREMVLVANPPADPAAVPDRAIMITFRDGSPSFRDQSERFLDQLHTNYEAVFPSAADQPQIVLVTHSAGGIVSRALLSNPWSPGGPWGYDRERCQRADYLADRVIFLVTVATPHTGSPIAVFAAELQDGIETMIERIATAAEIHAKYVLTTTGAGVGTNVGGPLGTLVGAMAGYLSAEKFKDEVIEPAAEGLVEFTQSMTSGERPVLRELDPEAMEVANRAHLSPDRARRSDGSLVPIYTLSGRTPGNAFFEEPLGILDMLHIAVAEGRAGREAVGIVMMELFLTAAHAARTGRAVPGPWGAPFPGLDEVDHVRRSVGNLPDFSPEIGFRPGRWALLRVQYDASRGGTEFDTDGMVGFGSGHGFRLGTEHNEYFSHEALWPVGEEMRRGSWYRVYDARYPGGSRFEWSWSNHGFIHHEPLLARWIHHNLIRRDAGPYVGPERFSLWEREESQ